MTNVTYGSYLKLALRWGVVFVGGVFIGCVVTDKEVLSSLPELKVIMIVATTVFVLWAFFSACALCYNRELEFKDDKKKNSP
jgi:hypothetical protein